MDAAFEAIMTPTLKRLLDGKAAVALVVIVPAAAWVAPFQEYWKRRLGDRWHIYARDGSVRLEHRARLETQPYQARSRTEGRWSASPHRPIPAHPKDGLRAVARRNGTSDRALPSTRIRLASIRESLIGPPAVT